MIHCQLCRDLNGQCTACGDFNGICTGLVGQLLAIQIERNFIVRFHFQSTTGQRNIALKDIVPCRQCRGACGNLIPAGLAFVFRRRRSSTSRSRRQRRRNHGQQHAQAQEHGQKSFLHWFVFLPF